MRGTQTPRTAEQVALMRGAGAVVYEVLEELTALCKPGVTTFELARAAEARTRKRKAIPIFRGYGAPESPFPEVICISVNEEVVHGIPSRKRVIRDGDLVKLDFGVSLKGWIADSARTVAVGAVSQEARALKEATEEALRLAISAARAGATLGDVGAAVQRFVESKGYSVVRDFSGHGVGQALHEAPSVPNFGRPGEGTRLRAGMTIALEPMVNAGTHKVEILDDEWTAVTLDRRLSAHCEHTILVADGPAELLTLPA